MTYSNEVPRLCAVRTVVDKRDAAITLLNVSAAYINGG